jgi:hypothetical protein
VSDELPPGVRSSVVAQAPAPKVLNAGSGTFEITGSPLTLRAWQAYSFAPNMEGRPGRSELDACLLQPHARDTPIAAIRPS